MTRRARFLASLVALFAIAFAQLAIAAHACERMTAQRLAAATTEDHGCCPDSGRTPQCAEHCNFGFASVDSAKPASIHAVTGPFLGVVAQPPILAATLRLASLVPPASGPPPPLRFFALRI